MATLGIPTITATGIPVDLSRSLPARDASLAGVANNGVRFMMDASFPFSYPGGPPVGRPAAGTPTNNALIQDMAERANGLFLVPAGSSIAYAGGGFDFTNSQGVIGTLDNGVQMPASVLSDIYTPYSGKSQRFLFSCWVKLPTLANWNSTATLLCIAGDKAYSTQSSLFSLSMQSGGYLSIRRQTAAATVESGAYTITPASGDYGSVVQLAYWRNDSGQGFRLKSANGTVLSSLSVGVDNTRDFSANTFTVGRAGSVFGGASTTAVITALSGFRVYRCHMENLARSGRDPVATLDSGYAAVTARGVFS